MTLPASSGSQEHRANLWGRGDSANNHNGSRGVHGLFFCSVIGSQEDQLYRVHHNVCVCVFGEGGGDQALALTNLALIKLEC